MTTPAGTGRHTAPRSILQPAFAPTSLHLATVAIASIVLGTAVPVELRTWTSWTWTLSPPDFAANVLLYAPLGWSLRRKGVFVALAAAAVLSSTAETLQGFMVGRYSAVFDVAANVCGAAVGAVASHRTSSRRPDGPVVVTPGTGHIAFALLLLCGLLATWFAPSQRSDLSSWEREYRLLLGNERTGERPWNGTIHQLAVVPAALPLADLHRTIDVSGIPSAGSDARRGSWRLPLELDFADGDAWVADESVSREFIRAAMDSGQFSVVLALTPVSAAQSGPARFVSLSDGLFLRNFDLGQEGSSVVFRVRTPVSGNNGMNPFTSTDAVLSGGRRTMIAATYDGGVSRIFVDGTLQGRTNIAAKACLAPSLCDEDLPPALGAAAAIITLVLLSCLRHAAAGVTGTALGCLGALSLYYAATLVTGQPYFAWAPLWSLAGAATIAVASRDRAMRPALPWVAHEAAARERSRHRNPK